jgi:hypothetical protein
VIFNERETFNGDLKDDTVLHIRLDELSELLHKCAIPNESEEELVQPAQEETEEVWELAENELYVETETEAAEKQSNIETRVDGPYPTPLPSPESSSIVTDSINTFGTRRS